MLLVFACLKSNVIRVDIIYRYILFTLRFDIDVTSISLLSNIALSLQIILLSLDWPITVFEGFHLVENVAFR